ncbi:MAG: asparagine synthetase A [Candidatus Bathyarchaeia archaeon]
MQPSWRVLEEVINSISKGGLLDILKIQTTVLSAIEDFMISRGFVQLMPVITAKVTDPLSPEPNSSVVEKPKIKYQGEELVLTQSMILHKQLALLTGAERIFVMSPNVRLEDPKKRDSGKHLFEFTQMDFEIKEGTMDLVMSLLEDLIVEVISSVSSERWRELKRLGRVLKAPPKPFKVYTSHELEERYGKDWEIPASFDHTYPFWVTCFKREFYDREDPYEPGHYRNYDLIYPEGYGEGVSGGEREWKYERLVARIKDDGMKPSEYESYLAVAKMGLLFPSAGAGIGVERLVRFIVGVKHIADIQPFRRVPGESVLL